jgi:hypothetical protein
MTRYVWQGDQWVNARTGEPMEKPFAGQVVAPRVMPDIPEYASPITGEVIGSRSARREDLIKHDCYEIDPPKQKRGLRNPHFAAKRGLKVREDGPIKDVAKEREALRKRRAIPGV